MRGKLLEAHTDIHTISAMRLPRWRWGDYSPFICGSAPPSTAERRPGPNFGKAVILWEETGKCTTGAAGIGVEARRDRFAELTPGRSYSQQGLTATCKDRPTKAVTVGGRRA